MPADPYITVQFTASEIDELLVALYDVPPFYTDLGIAKSKLIQAQAQIVRGGETPQHPCQTDPSAKCCGGCSS